MRSTAPLLSMLACIACVGRPLTTGLTADSPSPVPDVFTCVRQELKRLDFDQTSIDVKDYRITAKQYDETVRRPDVRFRRVVDRLEIEAVPASSGGLTRLMVNARTFAELVTQRGPTEEQERTSENAQKAAQTLIDQCRTPVDSTKVPG